MKDKCGQLTDGLDEAQRLELGDLKNLVELLESEKVPEPGTDEHVRLLSALKPYLPIPSVAQPRSMGNWLHLARSQLILFESSFWLAGALILLLGLFLTAIDGRELLPLAFVLLSPLLAAAGVAYAFRPETRTLGELERLTATGAAELLYTRLALVLAFNLLISFFLLLLIWLEGPQVVLWRLALAWLGPMLALTGLALYITIRWGSLVGAILPLGLWGSLALLGWREALLRAAEGMTPAAWLLLEVSRSDPALIGSLLACIVGLGLLVLAGRAVTGEGLSWS
jgi:hypothetical protein